MKLSGVVFTVMVGAVTLRVTGMTAGLPVAPMEATVTVPLYIPADRPDKTDEFIDTLSDEGTGPPGVAESQAPPVVVPGVAV